MPKGTPEPLKEGDKVFIIDDKTLEVSEAVVKSAPSELIYVSKQATRTSPNGMEAYGPARYAKTKKDAVTKAISLATNKRAELTDKLAFIDSAIAKLNKGKN